MRIGIVSKWFNRGQPVVGRQLRSAVDELGHESFVLARPKRDKGPRPGALDRDGVWDQPGVTEASAFEIPEDEYLRWAERELDRRGDVRQPLPVRRDRVAARRGRADDRALRLGALLRRARRAGQAGLRRRLLDDARRARALPRHGHRGVPRPVGLPPRDDLGRARARPRGRPPDLSRRLRRPSQAARRGGRGLRRDLERAPAAADQGPGRPQAAQARAQAGARRTRGSSSCSRTSRPPSTSRRSRTATSASLRRAGRGSDCRSSRRPPSGCRSSPTTTRR